MAEFRWVGDDEQQELLAGCNDTPLVWLQKRKTYWSAAVWVPGVEPRKEYDTLENHKADLEAKLGRWLALAVMDLPAMGYIDPVDDGAPPEYQANETDLCVATKT